MRYFLLGLVTILCCFLLLPIFLARAQTVRAVTGNWDMFGYNSWHQRVNPYEFKLNKRSVSHLTLEWTISTGGVIESLDTIVSNGIAYFTSQDGKLYAANATTGAVLWKQSLNPGVYNGGFAYSSPAVANGILYIEVEKNTAPYTSLYALNAQTGSMLWVVDGVGPLSSPTIVHGVLYAGGINTVYALNAQTGAMLWSNVLSTVSNYILDSPAVVNGVVYIDINGIDPKTNVATGLMYALNAATGTVKWETVMPTPTTNSSPAVANGFVYVGGYTGSLYAFDTATGQIKWTSPNIGYVGGSPAVAYGMVYIGGNGTSNHKLFAFNAKTGKTVWLANTSNSVTASAVIANQVVYDTTYDGGVYAFDALTGITLWTGTAGSCPSGNNCTLSSPVVSNGVLYIGGSDSKMYAFHLHS